MATAPAEHTALTAAQALRERLLDAFLLTTYEQSCCDAGDLDVAVDRFENSGVDVAIETICADPLLRGVALREDTEITTEGMDTERPLFRFDNGGAGDPLYCDTENGEFWFEPDLPPGIAMVVYGETIATSRPARGGGGSDASFARQAHHRRAEAALFNAEADKLRTGDYPERGFATALEELAEACAQDAESLDGIARDLRRTRIHTQMEHAVERQRGHSGRSRSGSPGRRLDRRLADRRPRPRAVVRSSSRGGDSGDPDPGEPEPPDRRHLSLLHKTTRTPIARGPTSFRCSNCSNEPGCWSSPEEGGAMRNLDLHDTDFRGRTSRPAGSVGSSIPQCTRCGTPLGGRLFKTVRTATAVTRIWVCGCGRRRKVRRAVSA
jgi:hypothetical protein